MSDDMRPQRRWPAKKAHGPALNFRQHTNFDGMTPRAKAESEIANYERVRASRALKPPRKRVGNG